MLLAFYVQVTQEIGACVTPQKSDTVAKTNSSRVFGLFYGPGRPNR
jgi:hypothetical protein